MAMNPTSRKAHILVVDDEPDLRTLYEMTLLREGYHVDVAEDLEQAWQLLSERSFDVLITDMRLPDGLGIELIHRLRVLQRGERCVVITAHGSAENAVESLKAGAFDYLSKPVELKQFRSVIASAAQDGPQTRPDAATLPRQRKGGHAASGANDALARLVGISPVMQQVKERISKVANSMAPVLICGESGTGKELVASALHGSSHRRSGPFVAVNCGAIPENLMESEFFGVRKGAYTGATQDREGFYQAAAGGSLFLDEMGELPLAMQAKLLRAVQERRVRPVGAAQEESVDVRIISATHKDLATEVAAGRFRQDLYYRLNVIEINIPPLRERREDLPALCEALLQRIAAESGVAMPELSPDLLAQLSLLPLHGNVRELENLLHRAVALSDEQALQLDTADRHIETSGAAVVTVVAHKSTPPLSATASPELTLDLQGHLDQQERDILVKTLTETGFNRTAAAARLGLSLRQIRYRMARLNIDVPQGGDTL
jgi:two-component system, NtrC family, response regulator PilR